MEIKKALTAKERRAIRAGVRTTGDMVAHYFMWLAICLLCSVSSYSLAVDRWKPALDGMPQGWAYEIVLICPEGSRASLLVPSVAWRNGGVTCYDGGEDWKYYINGKTGRTTSTEGLNESKEEEP